ncbi:MAG TPA: zinc ribbon domain-containing protein [Burkholderiaceae bacterium]|nr:zinc ribbon domain-containing protein [Burkholderiaceae bacterium]
MEDRASCEKAIRNGAFAAMISAVLAAGFGLAGFFTSSTNATLNYLLDPWILLDVVLLVVLAVFVLRKSRVAATLLVVYFVAAKLMMWAELGKATGLPMTIIFLYFYANAMRGTFKWHTQYSPAASQLPVAPEPTKRKLEPPEASMHASAHRFCVHCGAGVLASANFCVTCGGSVRTSGAQSGAAAR